MTEAHRTATSDRESIEVIAFKRIRAITEIKEAFEFRKDRPAYWLQRSCLWILRKLGCFACTETVKIERHIIGKRGKRFMDALFQQRDNLIGNFDCRPTRLLIGAEDYARLMSEDPFETGFSFQAEYYMGNGRGMRPTVCGLTIEVVPWMRGMLVMP